MGGRSSRNKGKTGEYGARDFFREMGWAADRVPSSGAAQGFPGDLVIEKGGVKLRVEVKFKKDEYKTIYAMLDNTTTKSVSLFIAPDKYITCSYSFNDLKLNPGDARTYLFNAVTGKLIAPVRKLISMQKLVKECDFLMVRINHKPWMFIRYMGFKVESKLPVS